MEIRNLKTFLKAASMQNFTHAAKALGYSQSSVSAQIAQLEQEIGAPLFNRIGRQVTLTQYGEELLPYARELCTIALRMEQLTQSEAFLGGTVRVGLTDSISELLLEDALISYHERFPRVQLELSLDTTEMLLERLKRGELDAACVITDPLPAAEWQIWAERSARIAAAANPALEICRQDSVTLKALAGQPLVLMERAAPYSLQFEQALSQRRLECSPVFRLQSAAAALRLIERSPFVTILPLYTVQSAADAGRVKLLSVPEWEVRQTVQTVLHRGKAMTPQVEGLLEELDRSLNLRLQ